MRRSVFVLLAAGCVVIAFGAHQWRQAQQQEAAFSAQYLSIAQEAPDRLLTLFEAAIPVCMPSASHRLLGDVQVHNLAAESLLKSGVLMAEGKSAEQSSDELIPWITKTGETLTRVQKTAFVDLLEAGLSKQEVMLCVMSRIKGQLNDRLDVKAMAWPLRV
jgi:hypothetical protein